MRQAILAALAALAMAGPAVAASTGQHVVAGVEGDDMLKLRAGPGLGFAIIAGLPNGTTVQVHDCQQVGSTQWCNVSLRQARELRGYVSGTYLRKK